LLNNYVYPGVAMETLKIDDTTTSMSNYQEIYSIKQVVPKKKHLSNVLTRKIRFSVFKWKPFIVILKP